MEYGFWFSAILGLAAGGIYLLLGYVGLRRALAQSRYSFMIYVFGGMAVRLFLAAGSIALVIALAPVRKTVFLAVFFGVFLIGLVFEVVVLHRLGGGSNEDPG